MNRNYGKRKMEHEFALLINELVPNGTTSEDYLEELIDVVKYRKSHNNFL